MPIAPVLRDELATWGRRDGWLVPCPRRFRSGAEHRVARARDASRAWLRAGVDEAVWSGCPHHAFRAGFQSGLHILGADPEAVKHLVGHSRGTRDRYVGPTALPLVEVVRLVPPVAVGTRLVRADLGLAVHQGGGHE
jgi:hypothetical protein